MTKHANEITGEESAARVAVGTRVRVYPGTDAEDQASSWKISARCRIPQLMLADQHIADAARRWAVTLDTGTVLFIDSDDLHPE